MNKKVIIVLGMHRSGTSAIAGILNKLGVSLGSKLLKVNEFNEKGYFENSYIVDANDKTLQSLDSSWDDLFLREEEWWQDSQLMIHTDIIKHIINQEFGTTELFCIKDPRISILLPLWTSVFQQMNIEICFIIPVRHPMEVAESLKKRDGFSIHKGILLWMNYMLHVEYFSRKFKRAFFVFDELLNTPEDVIGGVSKTLNIDLPKTYQQIKNGSEEFLDVKIKHYNIKDARSSREMLPLIWQYYVRLIDLVKDGNIDDNVSLAIDEIRNDYKILNSTFYNQDIRNGFLGFKKQLEERSARVDSLENELKELSISHKELNIHARELETHSKELETHSKELETHSRELGTHVKSLESAIMAKDVQIDILEANAKRLEDCIKNLNGTLSNIYNSHGWKILLVYYRMLDKIFPYDTKRRRVCKKILKSVGLSPMKE